MEPYRNTHIWSCTTWIDIVFSRVGYANHQSHDLLPDYGSCPLCDESARSSRTSSHEFAFDDLSNKPRAEEHVALTIASVERLILPTSISKT